MRVRTAAVGGLVEDNPLAAAATTLNSAGLSALPVFAVGDFALIMFDPDGRTGEPFAKRVTAHGSNAVTATIDAAAIYGTARAIDRDTPWRLTDILDQDGNGSGLLARKEYAPGTDTTIGTTTSATAVDVDATNLAITFTVPPSGAVEVILESMSDVSSANAEFWMVREAAATVAGPYWITSQGGATQRYGGRFLITGLTPGASKTYKWGYSVNGGSTARIYGGPTYGKAVMEVWAVNV